jgi:hypothetical protein
MPRKFTPETLQELDKLNKKLKRGGADSSLNARRILFEQVRSLWSEARGVWCAIDIEAWERDSNCITEFGWSMFYWVDGKLVEENGHLINKQYETYRNGQYVPEMRQVIRCTL